MSITVADVIEILKEDYRYTPSESDSRSIQRAVLDRIEHFKIFCNRKDVPKEAELFLMEMSAAQFLYKKFQTGGMEDGGITFPKRLSQITEGDTSLSFSGAGKEEDNFKELLDETRHGDYHILEHFRKLPWK